MKTAAIVLYVIQLLGILGCVITGKEFIDFSSGPALLKTIGFFFPAILGAILEAIADNKERKEGKATPEPSKPTAAKAPQQQTAATKPAMAENAADTAAAQPAIHPSIQYCPKCGTKQSSENGFCVACGNKLG